MGLYYYGDVPTHDVRSHKRICHSLLYPYTTYYSVIGIMRFNIFVVDVPHNVISGYVLLSYVS